MVQGSVKINFHRDSMDFGPESVRDSITLYFDLPHQIAHVRRFPQDQSADLPENMRQFSVERLDEVCNRIGVYMVFCLFPENLNGAYRLPLPSGQYSFALRIRTSPYSKLVDMCLNLASWQQLQRRFLSGNTRSRAAR